MCHTLNLSTATEASDRDLTENGVTFRAKVMALNTVTTVKACRHGEETSVKVKSTSQTHEQ